MRLNAEVVSIGDELLSGKIVNNNAAFISRQLCNLGIEVSRQVSLPDDPILLEEGLAESLACAPLVIATGGLGPTLDDNTRKVAADLFHTSLELNRELVDTLRKRFGDLHSIEDQATVPARAEILPNHLGTASGLILCGRESTLILLPGVPHEMEALMEKEVIPYIQRCFALDKPQASLELHFFRAYESEFDPLLRTLKESYPALQIGIYPRNGLVSITLKGDAIAIAKASDAIREQFSEREYVSRDGKIETALHTLLLEKKLTLSLAESCTGGTIASRLIAIPGASHYFLGGVVAYSNSLKESLLGVSAELIREKGAVSPEVAMAMAEGMQSKTGSDLALAVTGVAGPDGGSPEKPVGTVFVGIKKQGGQALAIQLKTRGSRFMIIDRASSLALAELLRLIS